MLFNSYEFLLLLLLTISAYYLYPFRSVQVPILIISSFAFYGYGQPELVLLLIVSILINATIGFLLERPQTQSRKLIAFLGVAANLSILLFYKYVALFVRTLGFTGQESALAYKLLHIPLPLGISFFTFQGISLVVDTYRNPGQNLALAASFPRYVLNIALFKAFFPQLISGPIVKAHEFLPQIAVKRWQDVDFVSAIKQLVLGYFLKMVVADNLKDQTAWLQYPFFTELSSFTLGMLLVGYSCQIFSDFAGYSAIARGLGFLFGYRLPINFNYPYVSSSFSEFWRRWHISLSTWLKQYLYIPLGGNRRSASRTYFNLMVVMVLGGFWHGAAWNYLLWGFFHGLCLSVERLLGWNQPKLATWVRLIRTPLIFAAVSFSWLLFKLPNVGQMSLFLRCLVTNPVGNHNYSAVVGVVLYGAAVALLHLHQLCMECEWCRQCSSRMQPIIFGMLIFLTLTNSGRPGSFIYFQF